MKDMDKRIRDMAKKEKMGENAVFAKQVNQMAQELVRQSREAAKKERGRAHWRKYIAAAVCAVVAAAYPVRAATDYLAERLAGISEEEKDEIRSMVYENNQSDEGEEKEAVRYSRDFFQSEQELYNSLWEQYEKGRFPKGALSVTDDVQASESDTVRYSPKDNCMYLPDHKLTEEELLQMIDFYHKTDYSLQTADAALEYKEDMKNRRPEIPAGALSEDEAVSAAAFYTETMYGISVDDMERKTETDDGDYMVYFIADDRRFSVCVQADNGALKSVSMEQEGFAYYQDNTEADEDRIRRKGEEAQKTAVLLLGEEAEIEEAYARYKTNAQGLVPHGSVVFLFDLADGDRFRMSYSIAEDALWGAALEKGGAGHRDMNVGEDEKRVFLEINSDLDKNK